MRSVLLFVLLILTSLSVPLSLASCGGGGGNTPVPVLNMRDVNGDGIDDFMLGAIGNSSGGTEAGKAYLFLGRQTWSNIDLSTQTASASYYINGLNNANFGWNAKVVGDINNDGYADLAISTPLADINSVENDGLVAIIFGAAEMQSRVFSTTDASGLGGFFIGPEANAYLGAEIVPAGDVNKDGMADIVVASKLPPSSGRYWLVLGRTSAFPDPLTTPSVDIVANAHYDTEGTASFFTYPAAACDINNDGYSDMIFSSPTYPAGVARGRVYVILGSATPLSRDLRSESADITIEGDTDNTYFGIQVACNDINGDSYADLIVGSTDSSKIGKVSLFLGSSTLPATPNAIFTPPGAGYFGLSICTPGDINADGFNDFIVAANVYNWLSTKLGASYVFAGSSSPTSIDLSAGGTPLAAYSGPSTLSVFGLCLSGGDINHDGYADIILGAPYAPGGGTERGAVYIMLGTSPAPRNAAFELESPDILITGEADENSLCVPLDIGIN